ncbi:hypothetical protein Mzhil_0196 [Methanosalsum zhilinae DSM 4017]|uniref:Uncharacterized protein n=1 Tax=Methanosalsum zhilinae (strain DSM 4017 / NBRC 107636 / OCM 62 / WeN5) TaxID=679901 RepID=F7XNB4_METZD|nr:hypothetical protein Mzhil_0196 [Methanosalsum zhilinae DSM 4017]
MTLIQFIQNNLHDNVIMGNISINKPSISIFRHMSIKITFFNAKNDKISSNRPQKI